MGEQHYGGFENVRRIELSVDRVQQRAFILETLDLLVVLPKRQCFAVNDRIMVLRAVFFCALFH